MVRGGDVMLSSKTKCVWCFDFDFDFQEISRVRARFLFLRVSPLLSIRLWNEDIYVALGIAD
jgi:hypothetical protein